MIYGVNTGFGALSNTRISPQEIKRLQTNLIGSHSSGVGKRLSREIVRALMLLRINTLAKGYSGIRPETLETIVEMLNKGVYPIIPAKGSVGASGDLAPISHDSGAYWRRQSDDGKRGYTTEHTSWLFQSRLAAEKEFQALKLPL